MNIYSAFDPVADLLAALDPAELMALKASGNRQTRFDELVQKSADHRLTKAEKDELDHYVVLERLLRLAKLRAEPVMQSGKQPPLI